MITLCVISVWQESKVRPFGSLVERWRVGARSSRHVPTPDLLRRLPSSDRQVLGKAYSHQHAASARKVSCGGVKTVYPV